jgi:iron complex transport system permease protein
VSTATQERSAIPADAVATVIAGRRRRSRRRAFVTGVLVAAIVGVFTLSLMIGQTFYGLDEVARVIAGETVPGASFTVGELRLPRAVLSVLVMAWESLF